MKQRLQKLVLRLDALSLRERVFIFAGIALALVILLKMVLLDPMFDRQSALSKQIKQDQEKIAAIQLEIQQKVISQGLDPDKVNQEKLQRLREQAVQTRQELTSMQKNLVAPEKMPVLLEDILKRNGSLRLVSLKNLPVTGLNDTEPTKAQAGTSAVPAAATPAAAASANKTVPEGPIFRHGVEIVVQGNYMDMMRYMAALESMPWELYWGKAKFQVDAYPVATLTLTLYTLSLDKSWLNL